MDPILDVLNRRKSVRAYLDEPLSDAEKQAILQSAMRAPTAGNMMLYSIITVEDQALKDRLAITCDDQPFIAKAPFVLLFLADYQRWYDYYQVSGVENICRQRELPMRTPQEGDLLLACSDALISAQTAVTAAEALGIGSCYIGDIVEHYEEHRKLFELPPYALPITLVCFGRPTPNQVARPQPSRFSPEFIVHQNTYRRLYKEQLTAMLRERETQFAASGLRQDNIENAGQFNYFHKFSAEFSIEMNRSVRAMIHAWCGRDSE
ncbi:MAG: nitroreductase family protein [Anaerolineaceae bacterium]|nr:nitroreductase family protein [Anaerolineaceae bacterium]